MQHPSGKRMKWGGPVREAVTHKEQPHPFPAPTSPLSVMHGSVPIVKRQKVKNTPRSETSCIKAGNCILNVEQWMAFFCFFSSKQQQWRGIWTGSLVIGRHCCRRWPPVWGVEGIGKSPLDCPASRKNSGIPQPNKHLQKGGWLPTSQGGHLSQAQVRRFSAFWYRSLSLTSFNNEKNYGLVISTSY